MWFILQNGEVKEAHYELKTFPLLLLYRTVANVNTPL